MIERQPKPGPRTGPAVPGTAHPLVEGALALDPCGAGSAPAAPQLALATGAQAGPEEEVRVWAARFCQGLVEVLVGHRPVTQLVRWTSTEVYRDLDRRTRLVRRAAGGSPLPTVHPQVRSVHVCRPTADSAEVSVHVRHGRRSRALALRLERRQERWVCTVMEYG